MTRQDKIDEIVELQNEIEQLKDFDKMLQYEETISHRNKFWKFCIHKVTSFHFLGFWNTRKAVHVLIPSYMVIEIAAINKKWIEELERRANEIIPE